jgi:hypothetical protein
MAFIFLHHYVPLRLDGALGNAKLVSDLFIQQTGNDQPHDCHVRKGPLHGDPARDAYSPDGGGISPHRLVEAGTVCGIR